MANKSKGKTTSTGQTSASSTSPSKPSENITKHKAFDSLTGEDMQNMDVDQTKYYLDYIIAKLSSASGSDTHAIELSENCLPFLNEITRRIDEEKFETYGNDNVVLFNLLRKVARCEAAISSFKLRFTVEKAGNAAEKAGNAAEKAGNAAEKAGNAARRLRKMLNETNTSTLTIMGVFATIVTVILSVVVTSSSWLNNADGASAVVAFVVPSLVAVSATVVLLGIILTDPDKRAEVVAKAGRTVIIVAAFALFIWIGYRDINWQHTRYILAPGMYQVETVDTDGKERVIKFEIEAGKYMIPYKRDYFHEGETLYFCMQHKKLE